MDTDVILAISISFLTAACCVGFWIGLAICEFKIHQEQEQEQEQITESMI